MTQLSTKGLVRSAAAFLLVTGALYGAGAHANEIVVCKMADPAAPVASGTFYNFTLDNTTQFSVAVGGDCVPFPEVGAGNHVITEAATSGSVVTSITVDPPERLISVDVALGTVTAEAVDNSILTYVTFYNAVAPTTTQNQGCTPGYWKQSFHSGSWTGYTSNQTVGSVFTGVDASLSGETLLTALQGGGGPGLVGAEKILLRAAVAALLNANSSSVAYPMTASDIISAVNTALATGSRDSILTLAGTLDTANNGAGGCPLS